MPITRDTEYCSHCDETRELIYRRKPGNASGHWLCAVCYWPIRDFQKLEGM